MTTIDRYIATTFLSSYILLLLIGLGLFVFIEVVFNLDEYTETPDISTFGVLAMIAQFHGARLPLYFHQLGGVMLAIAAAFTFAKMLYNNELTPLVAAGVQLQRLAVPVLLCSVVLVALWLINSEVILPANAARIARTHDDLGAPRRVQVQCVRDDNNAILSAGELNARDGWLKEVYIIEPDEQRVPAFLISADAAYYDPATEDWRLERGTRLRLASAFEDDTLGTGIRREPVATYPFGLAPDQVLLRQSSKWAELMSIQQMNRLLASRNLPNLPRVARARDIRFTQPLLMWILILLAVPFFLTREPANVLVAGGKALLLTGLCFGFTFLAHGINAAPQTAQLVVALPVLLFGPAAILHLANVKT